MAALRQTLLFRTFSCRNPCFLARELQKLVESEYEILRVRFDTYDSSVLLHFDFRLVDNCFQLMTSVFPPIAFLDPVGEALWFIFPYRLITYSLTNIIDPIYSKLFLV